MWYVRKIDYDSELYHHGIKGQKWGDKNGPPYPLGASDHSSSEIKEGRKGWSKEAKKEKINTRKNKRQLRRDKRAQKYYNKADKYQSKIDSLKKKGRSKRKINRLEKKKQKALHDAEIKKNGKLTKKEKAMVIGATVVAAYATYKFIDSGHARQMITKGKQALGIIDYPFKKNEELAKKGMSEDEIFDKVVKGINPNYGKNFTSYKNCRRCTFAYEMSRRGYDVQATETFGATGQSLVGVKNALDKNKKTTSKLKFMFDGVDLYEWRERLGSKDILTENDLKKRLSINDYKGLSNKVFDKLSELPNGARGELEMHWLGGGAHSMAFEVINNKAVIFDCQTGKKYDRNVFDDKSFDQVLSMAEHLSYTRLDNLDLNEDFLERWVKNRK